MLADVHQGGAGRGRAGDQGVRRRLAGLGAGRRGRSAPPSSCARPSFSPGPWRTTLIAATMLNQSKTAHQAEIDAACELIDFLRFNVEFMTRIYTEQPVSSPGVWNRLEYRPLEGFVFAVSPFNFTAIGGNLTTSPALMGNTVLWKPASTAALSAYYTMQLLQEAGPPGRRDQPRLRARLGDRRSRPRRAPTSPASTSPARRRVFQNMWKTVGANIERYRNYPRIVGETGGKDFIVAHPSADVDVARDRDRPRLVRVPGPEVLGRLARVRAVEPLAGAARAARRPGRRAEGRRRRRLRQLHGRRDRLRLVRDAEGGDRGGAGARRLDGHRRRRLRRQRGLLRPADRDRDDATPTSGSSATSSSARSSPPTSTPRASTRRRSSSSTAPRRTG